MSTVALFVAIGLVTGVLQAIGVSIWGQAESVVPKNLVAGQAHELHGGIYPVYVADSTPVTTTEFESSEEDWSAFSTKFNAGAPGVDYVDVTLQGTTKAAVVITGIKFEVSKCVSRPAGKVYAAPIGDALQGRFVKVDLDRSPPKIVQSGSSPDNLWFGQEQSTGSPLLPIEFPWKVSLTDPLLLTVLAHSTQRDCEWSFSVQWASGDQSGDLKFDNAGNQFRVIGDAGARVLTDEDGVWEELGQSGPITGDFYK